VRLFSLTNASAVDDPVYGHFDASPEHGGFDFPDELSDRLHSAHYRRKPAWETEIERGERLHGEESARRRDPETLYNAVADIAGITKQLAGLRLDGTPDADVAALAAQVRELTARLAAMEGQDPAPAEDGGVTAEKPSRSRKAAPAAA
jgi:hypothetical protein